MVKGDISDLSNIDDACSLIIQRFPNGSDKRESGLIGKAKYVIADVVRKITKNKGFDPLYISALICKEVVASGKSFDARYFRVISGKCGKVDNGIILRDDWTNLSYHGHYAIVSNSDETEYIIIREQYPCVDESDETVLVRYHRDNEEYAFPDINSAVKNVIKVIEDEADVNMDCESSVRADYYL